MMDHVNQYNEAMMSESRMIALILLETGMYFCNSQLRR